MNSEFSTKLVALAIALMLNAVMIGAVSILFQGKAAAFAPTASIYSASQVRAS